MRILHISNPVQIPAQGYGGTERVVYNLARTQAERGHQVYVMAGLPTNIPGVMDASFAEGRPYNEGKFILRRFLEGYVLAAYRHANEIRYDVIHNHISEEAIPLSKVSHSPVLTTLHCPLTLARLWPRLITTLNMYMPRSTLFVSISRRSYDKYLNYFRKNLLSYVYSGIDFSEIPFVEKPQKEHEIQLAYLNKFVPEKRPEVSIKVADILAEKGYDVHLTLMGKLDESNPYFTRRLLDVCEKRSYVEILPNVPTEILYKVLGDSDALINPSIEIGLNLAQLEALSTGTPVLGLVDCVAEEVVQPGVNGFIAGDVSELARYCIEALELDRALCRDYVRTHFSLESMYNGYMEAYKHCMEQ